jgi:hypothetical protein
MIYEDGDYLAAWEKHLLLDVDISKNVATDSTGEGTCTEYIDPYTILLSQY